MAAKLLPATIVGSYPQPDWLIDRARLSKMVPRVRERSLWRVPEPWLEQAQDDATLLAVRDQERAGLDMVSDGEVRRASYFNRFATALAGIDLEHPGTARNRRGLEQLVPRRGSAGGSGAPGPRYQAEQRHSRERHSADRHVVICAADEFSAMAEFGGPLQSAQGAGSPPPAVGVGDSGMRSHYSMTRRAGQAPPPPMHSKSLPHVTFLRSYSG